jgi:hypothetical protein
LPVRGSKPLKLLPLKRLHSWQDQAKLNGV